ncbi:MAG: hypothetical protein IPO71_05380 [Nitrosomonas sp.]|nr:hypothetical protein [Nitrosomonas sp.]
MANCAITISVQKSRLFAGIIGLGCEIGTKMARISQAINESGLERTVKWFFSLEGTRAHLLIVLWH